MHFELIKKNLVTIGRLYKFSKECRTSYNIALIINAFTMIRYSFMIGFSIQWITDSAIAKDWDKLGKALMFFAVAYIVNTMLCFFEGYLMETRVALITGKIRKTLFGHLISLPIYYYDSNHSGDLQSRLTNDLSKTSRAISFSLVDPINFLSLGIINIIFITIINWKMTAICIATVAVIILINILYLKPIEKHSDEIQSSIGDATSYYSDIINGIPIIKTFNLQQWAYERYSGENSKILSAELKLNKINSNQISMNWLTHSICTFGILGIGSFFLANKEITIGSLLAIVKYASSLVTAFTGFGETLADIQRLLSGANRVFEILDSPTESSASKQVKADLSVDNVLTFDNITFSYADGKQVISNFSESISKDKTVAIIGPSGAGKTTILKIIMGFYELPDECGKICLYGKDIKEYSLTGRRSLITYVPQSSYLFSGTIRENISYGKLEVTEEEIINAAKAANAHEFIIKLPDGYDTLVGERGSFLSGGERQRIAIARALLKNSPILLLDEPTSSLDSESEQKIQEAIRVLMKGRTVIVIAHRLSTIQHADKILVLEQGHVTEKDSHEGLLKLNQRYAHYYKLLYG